LLAEQFFGINRAPADIDQSPAERMAREYSAARTPDEPRTAESAERRELRQSLTRALRQKKPIPPDALAALRLGKLSSKDVASAYEESGESSLGTSFKRLPIDQALRVYGKANAAEKLELAPELMKKRDSALKTAAPAAQAQIVRDVSAALAAQ
jgi:hypothetical protein